ncbi:hypothetical protein MTO96_008427 [Rhipicephalus appendiculatus]
MATACARQATTTQPWMTAVSRDSARPRAAVTDIQPRKESVPVSKPSSLRCTALMRDHRLSAEPTSWPITA